MGRGRPKGSKNKKTLLEAGSLIEKSDEIEIKKDNSLLVNLFGDKKEIKKEIRSLKKLKLQCRPGTAERLDLEHKIKDLKGQILKVDEVEPGKDKLIKRIKELDPLFEKLEINLNKFSEVELQIHLDKLESRKGLDK
jgi:hypothetical protein